MDTTVFVISNGKNSFVDWDDRGAMATDYPLWTSLLHARKYETEAMAMRAAEGVLRCKMAGNEKAFVQKVTLEITGEPVQALLPEDDPEWSEFKRLQEKFKGRA